jgi:hypothetical protein
MYFTYGDQFFKMKIHLPISYPNSKQPILRVKILCFITFLQFNIWVCMGALSIIRCWCWYYYMLAQAKTSDTICLFMEAVDLGCVDFVRPKDHGSIITIKCTNLGCR